MSCWLCVVFVWLSVCMCKCMRDYYTILGIPPAASEKQIKAAFHRLALQHHPDRNKSPDAQSTFTLIAEAYEVLSDRERRRQHLSQQEGCLWRTDSNGPLGGGLHDNAGRGDSLHDDAGSLSGKDFLHFSLDKLLQMLQMEEMGLFMGEEAEGGWSFAFGAEGDDDDDDDDDEYGYWEFWDSQ